MFEGFANVWTAVELSRNVKVGRSISVTIAGEKVALFRDHQGRVGALHDQCPHRGVKLSLGEVTADGCLACPFHGWEFDAQGTCQHVPLNPDAKRDRLFATPFPVREIGGLIWMYTAPGKTAPSEPQVPDAFRLEGIARVYAVKHWKAHWTRAMENMLDSPHLPWVHRRTIGRAMRNKLTRQSRMTIAWHDTPFGGSSRMQFDDSTNLAQLDFYAPNVMALHIPIPGKHFRIHAIAVPVGPLEVKMIVVGTRDFLTTPLLNPLFNFTNTLIMNEDQAVVESSFPSVVPQASLERSVATDRATLRFRRYYFEELAGSGTPPRPPLPLEKGGQATFSTGALVS